MSGGWSGAIVKNSGAGPARRTSHPARLGSGPPHHL